MGKFFDIDPSIINSDYLEEKITAKVRKTIENVSSQKKENKKVGVEILSSGCGWSSEELKEIQNQMIIIHERLQKMNQTWDINKHEVLGIGAVCSIKRLIWKLIRKLAKPLISGINDFNAHTTVTMSEIIKLQEKIISIEERRVKK